MGGMYVMSPCAFPGAGAAPRSPVAVADAISRRDEESASACRASTSMTGSFVRRSNTDASRKANAASFPSSLRGITARRSVHVVSAPDLAAAVPVIVPPLSSMVNSSVHTAASRA